MRHMLAVAIALAALTTVARAEWDVAAMNRQIDQTNFLVNEGCSGTLIDKDRGYILTANHCVARQFETVDRERVKENGEVEKYTVRVARPGTASQLTFSGPNETQRTQFVFKIKAHDDKSDLALLQVVSKLPNLIAAPIACTMPQRGEVVYSVGNPFTKLYSSVTKGIVSSTQRSYSAIGADGEGTTEDNSENGLIQHTASIEPGNSGGALYNDRGELVGVNVRVIIINETVGFAAPLDDIQKFLSANGVPAKACR